MSYAEHDYPYSSVSNALSVGYEAECRLIYQRDSTFAQYQGGSVRLPEKEYTIGMTAYERAGDPGKVVGLVRKVLAGHILAAVEGHYLPFEPALLQLCETKYHACSQLIPHIRRDMGRDVEGGLLNAVIAAWAKLMYYDGKRWRPVECKNDEVAERLGMSVKTVQRLRYGRAGHNIGIETALNDYLDLARAKLGNPMRDCGLIP